MVVTIYETQTPDGWDGLGTLTTLERATITQLVQQTITSTEGGEPYRVTLLGTTISETTSLPTTINESSTSSDSSSFRASVSNSASSQSPTATELPRPAQMSTGSIAGIAIGSAAALGLIATCILFAFGFRIRRAKRLGGIDVLERRGKQRLAIKIPDGQNGKAELEDAAYVRRLERLHDGAKPELDGSKPRKTGWKAFSIRSSKRGPRSVIAELDAGVVIHGPHELPA